MKIEVNEKAKTDSVKSWFEKSVAAINKNAEKGSRTTDLLIPKEIAADVRERLEEEVKGLNFAIVAKRPNPYTGRMDYFTGETRGENRFYKVTI